jgi:hypothetical protein
MDKKLSHNAPDDASTRAGLAGSHDFREGESLLLPDRNVPPRAVRSAKADRRAVDELVSGPDRRGSTDRREEWEHSGWWDEFETIDLGEGRGQWTIWIPWMAVVLALACGWWFWRYA